MAQCEVQALMEQQVGDDAASILFGIGFMIREAGERATRDRERAARDDEPSGELDREFHSGRASGYRFVLSSCSIRQKHSESPLAELALDGLDPEREIG